MLSRLHPLPLFLRAATGGAAMLAISACGEGTGPSPEDNRFGITATGPGVLSVSPLDTSTHFGGSPLGYLAPPGHVLPTDHVYLYFVDPWGFQPQGRDCSPRPVRAAGSGVVTFILVTEAAGDTKVNVQMTRTFQYYYDHVILKPGIVVGTHVNAGDTIATTTGRCPSIDLGVFDLDVTNSGLVNTTRYGMSSLHAASPYKYFSEPLRTWMYNHVRMMEGVPANKDGRVDWGIRGRLVGDWFHASLAGESANVIGGPAGWTKSLSFAYDWYDNTQRRISIGGSIAPAGVVRVAPTDPAFGDVQVTSGVVTYQTTKTMGSITDGWLLVQMTAEDRLRVQYFPGATARPLAFTAAAHDYVR